MEVDIPKLNADDEHADLDNAARALDRIGDFCGMHTESAYFIKEQLAVELNKRLPGLDFKADELPIKYSGFHGCRIMWPADLLEESVRRETINNRAGRRQLMKKERKRNKKGKYSYRPTTS